MGGIGSWPGGRQSGQLAHASRIRVGKPRLETLDPVLFREQPVRALRRTGMRYERVAGRRAVTRSMDRGSRIGYRCGSTGSTGDAAGHLTGWRGVHQVRDPASGTRRPHHSLWRLRTWRVAAWHADDAARVPSHDRLGAGGLGKGQPDIPAGLHVAFHSGGQPRAAPMVQRPLSQDDLRRDRCQAV